MRITWKSFEEEAKELMSQLERLRMQEVDKVKSQIVKARREGRQRLDKMDRQAEVLRAQGKEVEESIPRIHRRYADATAEEYRGLERIRGAMAEAEKEKGLLEALTAGQLVDSPAVECAGRKAAALEQFSRLQAEERRELQSMERRALEGIERLGAKREAEVIVAREKNRIIGEVWDLVYCYKSNIFVQNRRERGGPVAASRRTGEREREASGGAGGTAGEGGEEERSAAGGGRSQRPRGRRRAGRDQGGTLVRMSRLPDAAEAANEDLPVSGGAHTVRGVQGKPSNGALSSVQVWTQYVYYQKRSNYVRYHMVSSR